MWAIPLLFLFIVAFFVLVISISWSNMRGAPWVPTSMQTVHKMLTLAEVGPDDLVYDLGCGDGRTIVTAARRFGARAVGIEHDPVRYLWCQALITVLGLRDRVQVVRGDIFFQDLSSADVVTCYLLQSTNNRLEGKLKRELAPGTRIVSHIFTFQAFQQVRAEGNVRLYRHDPERNPEVHVSQAPASSRRASIL